MDMFLTAPPGVDGMEGKAVEVAAVLGALANPRRLQILCALIETGEANVGALVSHVGISQSALSQHLAKMRDEGILGFPPRKPDALVSHRRSADRGADGRTPPPLLPQTLTHPTRSDPMTIKHVQPSEAFAMLSRGAVLVDIREADEWRREHIPEAKHHALSTIERQPPSHDGTVIFHCRSGNRTATTRSGLRPRFPDAKAFLLDGALEAWRDAGLPTVKDARQPIEIMRQVQIGAGSLVALGTALGILAHPGFHLLSGAVGLGSSRRA